MFKELTVQEWFSELERGLEYRRLYGLEDSWSELEALFYNVHPHGANSGPNIISSTGDALLSALNVPVPTIMVKPTTPDGLAKSRIVESVDGLLLRELKVQRSVEDACFHAYLWGNGFLKVGYDSEFGWNTDLNVGQFGMSLSNLDSKGRRIEFDSRINPGYPWVGAVLPHDIVVRWGTKSLEDAPWVAHRIVRHIDDVKADDKYSHTRDIKPCMSIEDFVNSYKTVVKPYRVSNHNGLYSGARVDRSLDFVELWEIHDKRTGKIYVIASGHDKFLRNEENALYLEGKLPFVNISFVPTARTLWTTPDAFYLRFAQSELSDIYIQATKQRRAGVMKVIFDGDAFDEHELAKMESSDVAAYVKANSGSKLSESVLTLNGANNQQLYIDEQAIRQNARELVGFSRNQLGEFDQSSRRTATESSIVDRSSASRMGRRELAVKRLYEETFCRINNIIFRYWTAPRMIEVVGPQKTQEWIQYNGPQVRGKYDYDVQLGTAQDLAQRKSMALQLGMSLMQTGMVQPQALVNWLMENFNDPEFTRLLLGESRDAGLPVQMPTVQPSGRAGPSGGSTQQGQAQMLPR